MIPLVSPELDRYLIERLPDRHPVIAEMEAFATERDVPIVGPAVATLLGILARSIGARRVCELGSAIGYSTAFFAQAVGPGGSVLYTDGDERNARRAEGYLDRLNLRDRVEIRVGEAVGILEASSGDFDVVFIDIDKDAYPQALEAASACGPAGISSPTMSSGRARSSTRQSGTARRRGSVSSTAVFSRGATSNP